MPMVSKEILVSTYERYIYNIIGIQRTVRLSLRPAMHLQTVLKVVRSRSFYGGKKYLSI